MEDNFKRFIIALLVISVIFSGLFGGVMGYWAGSLRSGDSGSVFAGRENKTVVTVDEESAVIEAVETVSPAVVSIIVTKDLPKVEQYQDPFRQFFQDQPDYFGVMPKQQIQDNGETEKKEVGGGSGFIVSSDGYIVTNKHVVNDEAAEYTVLMNDGEKYPAKVLAKDQINDIAIMKIDAKKDLPTVRLGDSSDLKTGQTVIVIGNALGEFRNTVSTGVISGLSRSITATGSGIGSGEQLVGVIQTDASINLGNSGGPLVDIAGQVIGINVAIVQGAQGIGFAIPINEVKNIIDSVKKHGRIIRPWLGVRYIQVSKTIAEVNKLSIDYGALISRGDAPEELAIIPGSPADKAGLQENDIILEINGKKIDEDNPLAKTISLLKIGDEVSLKILRKGDMKEVKVRLEEMK